MRAAWRRARRFDEARIRNNKPTESLKQKKTKSQTMAMSLLMRYHTFQAAVEHNDELSHTVTKKQRLRFEAVIQMYRFPVSQLVSALPIVFMPGQRPETLHCEKSAGKTQRGLPVVDDGVGRSGPAAWKKKQRER